MKESLSGYRSSLLVIVGLGFFLRLPYLPRPGFVQDALYYRSCANYLSENPLTSIYRNADKVEGGIVNYPPVYLSILGTLGKAARLVSSDPFEAAWFLVLLKSVNVLADLAVSMLLYSFVQRRMGFDGGIFALALFWLNPGIIYLGSFFGQTEAVYMSFLVFSAACLRSRPFLAGCGCALAVGTKLQTLPFLPIFLVDVLSRRDWSSARRFLGGAGAVTGLLLAPFVLAGELRRLVESCFFTSLVWRNSLSVGAFNLWQLHPDPLTPDKIPLGIFFGSDGYMPADSLFRHVTYHRVGLLLFLGAYSLVVVRLARTRSRSQLDLWWSLAAVSLLFFFIPTRIHERYLFPFFAFGVPLTVSGGISRRLAFVFLSAFFLLNLLAVCPPDSRPVPLEQVHAGAADIVAVAGLLVAWIWAARVPRFASLRVVAAAAILTFFFGAAFLYRRSVSPPLSHYPFKWAQEWKVPRRDLSVEGNILQVGDRIFASGIGTHARSRLTFGVPERAVALRGWVGADVEVIGGLERTSLVFTVEVDGRQVYRSPVISSASPAQPMPVISLRGAKVLALVTEDAGDGNYDDHADWCGLSIEYEE